MSEVKKTSSKLDSPQNNLYLVVAAIIILAAGFIFFNSPKKDTSINNSNPTPATASSTINEVGKPKTVAYKGQAGKTALDLLKNAAQAEITGTGANAFVTSINGYKPDIKKEYWGFFVNGQEAQVGAGSYTTKDTDLIEWKLVEIK